MSMRRVILLLCLGVGALSQPSIITTLVGDYCGDGGAGTNAMLNSPSGTAVDVAGNVFIADSRNNRVRLWNKNTGIITTIVGSGGGAFTGDGGAGTNASVSFPRGIALDAAGNAYIADSQNNRVRLWNASTGVITTIAGSATFLNSGGFSGDGGPGSSAQLSAPMGVAVDRGGNVYIADTHNNRVRLWNASTGIIATIVGTGTAGFSGDGGAGTSASLATPYGVAVDMAGNVYIADLGSGRVRLLTKSTGNITTIVGSGGSAAFSGDGGAGTSAALTPVGVAVDAARNVYIVDGNSRVRLWNRSVDIITTIAGNGGSAVFSGDGGAGTSAALSNPYGVAVDSAGNAYIADTDSNRVRLWTQSTGLITTLAGNGGSTFTGDGVAGTSAKLNAPIGVASDIARNVYVADTGNNRVRLWTASTGLIATIAGTGAAGFSGDGGAGTSAMLNSPGGIAVDVAGNVYIADSNNNRVRLLTKSTGVITTIVGTGAAGFSGDGGMGTNAMLGASALGLAGFGIAVDLAGNVYIADAGNNRVRLWTQSTGIITTIAGTGAVIFVGDRGAGTNATLFYPSGIAVDAAGNAYIADMSNNRIRLWTKSTGIITTIAGTGTAAFYGDGGAGTSATLNHPGGVALDAAGNVYIADSSNIRLRLLSVSTGTITTIAGTGKVGFSGDRGVGTLAAFGASALGLSSFGIAVDIAGNVLIADTFNMRVRVLTAPTATTSATPTSPSPTSSATATLSPHGTSSGSVSAVATPIFTPSASLSSHPSTTSTAMPTPTATPTASPSPPANSLVGASTPSAAASYSPGAIIGIFLGSVGALALIVLVSALARRTSQAPLSSAQLATDYTVPQFAPKETLVEDGRVVLPPWAENPLSPHHHR